MLRAFIILFIITGCASTKPTAYKKEKKHEGFSDDSFEDLKIARFKGNSYTKKELAQKYAEFRAIENCSPEQKHANMIDIFDKTIQKEVTRTSGTNWGPSSYFGMYPYYSRYSSFGIGAGFSTISANSWNETLVYPIIEVYYSCAEKIMRPDIIFKEISTQDMKHLVKDVKGAIQVDKIQDNSLNKTAVEVGDIILKANGKRVEKVYELIRLFTAHNPDVTVQILRDGERVVAKMHGRDVTSEIVKAEQEIIQKVCSDKKDQDHLKTNALCK